MSGPMTGFVWLVGAGPGDPDLLTRKAERVLAEAEVVFYDGLVPLSILALAPRAQRFSVAKRSRHLGNGALRPGDGGLAQDGIHRLLIRAARRGKRVVRLKGGDPFVFGRGGEEALALAAAGVPFEIVPGISSALAAPGLAGIPVTHRGLASGFVVVAGYDAGAYAPILGGLGANAATVVVLMGLARRGEIADFLLARGWAAATPTAMLIDAATPSAHSWTGTLADLGSAGIPSHLVAAPGTLVIGEVVAVATTLQRATALPPTTALPQTMTPPRAEPARRLERSSR
jgi:uroporphyrin-III C-methyltransferase / precorrin-2 dehydrogenase / sirohydrochlorin ferrochelatase